MKQILILACALLTLSACKKKDEDKTPNPINQTQNEATSFGEFTIAGTNGFDGTYRIEESEINSGLHYAFYTDIDGEEAQQMSAGGVENSGQYWITMIVTLENQEGTGSYDFNPIDESVGAAILFYENNNGSIGTPLAAFVSQSGEVNVTTWVDNSQNTFFSTGKLNFSGSFSDEVSLDSVQVSAAKIEIF